MARRKNVKAIYNGSVYSETMETVEQKPKGVPKKKADEIEDIKIQAFKDLWKRYDDNCEMVIYMMVLPITIAAFDAAEMKKLVWELKARFKSGVLHPSKSEQRN